MKNLNPTQLLRLLAVAILLSFLAACSDDDKSEYGTLDSLFKDSKITACGTCHDGEDGGPDLSKSNFRNALVNKDKDNYEKWTLSSTTCSGINAPYITIGSPNKSAVLATLTQRYGASPECATLKYHETQNAVISGDLLTEFEDWIANGAN